MCWDSAALSCFLQSDLERSLAELLLWHLMSLHVWSPRQKEEQPETLPSSFPSCLLGWQKWTTWERGQNNDGEGIFLHSTMNSVNMCPNTFIKEGRVKICVWISSILPWIHYSCLINYLPIYECKLSHWYGYNSWVEGCLKKHRMMKEIWIADKQQILF